MHDSTQPKPCLGRSMKALLVSVILAALLIRVFPHRDAIPEIGRQFGLAIRHHDHAGCHLQRGWGFCLALMGISASPPADLCELIDLISTTIQPETGNMISDDLEPDASSEELKEKHPPE